MWAAEDSFVASTRDHLPDDRALLAVPRVFHQPQLSASEYAQQFFSGPHASADSRLACNDNETR
jgi:hypothetical protein